MIFVRSLLCVFLLTLPAISLRLSLAATETDVLATVDPETGKLPSGTEPVGNNQSVVPSQETPLGDPIPEPSTEQKQQEGQTQVPTGENQQQPPSPQQPPQPQQQQETEEAKTAARQKAMLIGVTMALITWGGIGSFLVVVNTN
jgi:outer membrane biosynthesis protein TonB